MSSRRWKQMWVIVGAAAVATPVLGQESAAAVAAEPVAPEVAAVLRNLEGAGEKLVALAEATPADQFGWAPSEEVRTVSEVYMHVVGTNLLLPPALGAAPPEGIEMTGSPFAMMAEWEATVVEKDDVLAKLESSLAYVTEAMASITDLDTEVSLFGPPTPKRDYFLVLMAHAHEHLGQSIAYARSIGVVPPWSQPLPTDGGGADGDGEGDDG